MREQYRQADMANVGRGGRFKANFTASGINRDDPFPRALRRIKSRLKRKQQLDRIMKRALEPMRKSMSDAAPVDTGALQESFRVRTLRKVPEYVWGYRVGAVSGEGVGTGGLSFQLAGWRDHWAELGTQHHDPTPHIAPAINQHASSVRSNLDSEIFAYLDGLLRKG